MLIKKIVAIVLEIINFSDNVKQCILKIILISIFEFMDIIFLFLFRELQNCLVGLAAQPEMPR